MKNKKGFFTAITAVLIIIFVYATLLSYSSSVAEIKQETTQNETIQVLQNISAVSLFVYDDAVRQAEAGSSSLSFANTVPTNYNCSLTINSSSIDDVAGGKEVNVRGSVRCKNESDTLTIETDTIDFVKDLVVE